MALLLALAAGTAQAQTAPDGKTSDNTVVVVTGVRASMRSAVAIKKNTQEIVDSISAEDIGKLPDNNVSETLTRIPGVQGYRYGGEGASPVGVGSGLTIRGLSGQTASQVDGRAYATAGLREFNIEDAIPGIVAGIDVYKNPSAEHIEGGIGGLVNLRTRHPSDFKGPTVSLSATARYNDLDNHVMPEVFGLFADKWDLPGGGRVGLMIGAVYQKSEGRSDNDPANGGASYRRMIGATDPEYASLAAANTANDPSKPMSAYVGRSDITYLANVNTLACDNITKPCNVPDMTGLTTAQAANIISAPTQFQTPVGEEIIKRTRKGFDVAADWVVDDGLRLYAESNYTYYMYNQNYMFLNSTDGRNVQNLKTTPFALDEGVANRNLNGGSSDTLTSQRLASGTFLNSDFTAQGGDEHHPYWTAIAAGGFEWHATPRLMIKGDMDYTVSEVDDDNRSVTMASAPSVWTGANYGWAVTRDLTGTPHTMTVSGPDLGAPSSWVFSTYGDGTNNVTKDKGMAVRFDGKYDLDKGFFTDVKAGVRFTHTEDRFWNYGFTTNYNLTTNGAGLISTYGSTFHSNGLAAASYADLLRNSLGNFMRGDAGYSGGFLVYSPALLLGDRVRDRFPLAAVPAGGTRAEQILSRRFLKEDTQAAYVMGDFQGFDDKIKGNIGVRLVKTDEFAQTYVNDTTQTPAAPVPSAAKKSYSDVLPSLNVTYYITPDFLARFGYGKGITRPGYGDLNPTISVTQATGVGSAGNPNLAPLRADNYDISIERYFSSTNYVSFDVFDKELNGFAYGIIGCENVPTAPAPTVVVAPCTGTQYQITRNRNAGKGYARGVEIGFQTFFDFLPGYWKHFGSSGSFTYLDTENPVNFGTSSSPRIVNVPQPFVSRYNYTLQGVYDDGKLSARLVYTWRSDEILFGISVNPIDGRYIGAYGIMDASVNYKLTDYLSVSFNANNLTDKGLDRFVGEPAYNTGIERQHYLNGRTYSLGLRYKFGG